MPSHGSDRQTVARDSVAFKQKMVQRLTGKNAVSASELARETGVRQQNLSRWLEDARSRPLVASDAQASGARLAEACRVVGISI
jgi:hypothetical protein